MPICPDYLFLVVKKADVLGSVAFALSHKLHFQLLYLENLRFSDHYYLYSENIF